MTGFDSVLGVNPNRYISDDIREGFHTVTSIIVCFLLLIFLFVSLTEFCEIFPF